MNTFSAPYRKYEDIRQQAKDFLNQHHPSLEIPIPIEDIIDNKMGIHVFPLPGLYRVYNQSGFLSKDRTTIYVDLDQYNKYPCK